MTKDEFVKNINRIKEEIYREGLNCYNYPACKGIYPYVHEISLASLTTPSPRFCNKCGHKEEIIDFIFFGTKND
jgi:hypothetical protein